MPFKPADLKRRRLALGLNQRELGERLDLTATTICRWEGGVVPIGHPRLIELALTTVEVREAALRAADDRSEAVTPMPATRPRTMTLPRRRS